MAKPPPEEKKEEEEEGKEDERRQGSNMSDLLSPEGSWRQWSRRVYAMNMRDNPAATHTPYNSMTPDISLDANFTSDITPITTDNDNDIGLAVTSYDDEAKSDVPGTAGSAAGATGRGNNGGGTAPATNTNTAANTVITSMGVSMIPMLTPIEVDGKIVLQEEDCYEILPINYPEWRKWLILCILFIVQISMNINCSIYSNAVNLLSDRFRVKKQTARLGQMLFLVAYAFGSELWAPWSEEWGRYPIMQFSLSLVNVWQLMCTCAGNLGTILVGRFLGGLSSAGGSVTLGVVADMWDPDNQHYAVAMIVLSSVLGSVFGPVVGGFMEVNLNWRWNFAIQLLLGVVAQVSHASFVPETRSIILLNRQAKRLRKNGIENIYGPKEVRGSNITVKGTMAVWLRPFKMFVTEPIVLCLSLLSGFSDALIFLFLESFQYVYEQWHFTTPQRGVVFVSIIIGNVIGFLSFLPTMRRHIRWRHTCPQRLTPESRLWWLLFTAPLEVIGLWGFAWTSFGPPIPWIAPTLFAGTIAVANYCIYMATIDYMVASYGEYSASATGGNAFARNLLAGISALYAAPLYQNIPGRLKLEWPSTILGFISIFVTIPIYVFYWKGPQIRARSKFACSVEKDRQVKFDRRMATQGRSTVSVLPSSMVSAAGREGEGGSSTTKSDETGNASQGGQHDDGS